MNDKEFKEWEDSIEKVKIINRLLLSDLKKWLKGKNLKAKTIKKHIDNIDFYINDFLLRYDTIPAENGALEIGSFLGDYFIRKASWASKYSIQENISSFKKFYTYLVEIEKTNIEDLQEMNVLIKEEKKYWIEEVENYWNEIEGDDW